ncbi:MAG: metallophosphoesterase [Clostridia bacterium]|nr:metallophosphoesterase [Clostridia bacterium]
MKITEYEIKGKVPQNLKLAFISDLHGFNNELILDELRKQSPDAVLIPGDVIHDDRNYKIGIEFLSLCNELYPTYMSLGNHETKFTGDIVGLIRETGVTLLENSYTEFCGIIIGGLTTGYKQGDKQGRFKKTPPPDAEWLTKLEKEDKFKILLSHHPEYYPKYLKDAKVDLILSGHAHGGQWRIFGRGIFAPGQGLFPKYTSGFHDGKLIVGRGLGNPHSIPRINNKPEFIIINLKKEETV